MGLLGIPGSSRQISASSTFGVAVGEVDWCLCQAWIDSFAFRDLSFQSYPNPRQTPKQKVFIGMKNLQYTMACSVDITVSQTRPPSWQQHVVKFSSPLRLGNLRGQSRQGQTPTACGPVISRYPDAKQQGKTHTIQAGQPSPSGYKVSSSGRTH